MKRQLVILGAGESGVGAALLGKKKGFAVFVSDSKKIASKYKQVLLQYEIDWEEEGHTTQKIISADIVIKSPGIPASVTIIKKLREAQVAIISEIEFAARFTKSKIIAVTGSNGKTTTVNWIAFILQNAGLNYVMAGNVGLSFAKSVTEDTPDYYVLEVSSFQLDDIEQFHPHIAVLTTITPDHLDRYNYDFQQYINAKFRIVENQTKDDFFIYNADDAVISKEVEKRTIKAKKIPFTLQEIKGLGTGIMNHKLTTTLKEETFSMPVEDLSLKGEHNTKNAMAAATVASLLKIRKQTIRASLERFQGVEHRLENVLKVRNVQYINDSKATNINSTYYALNTVKAKIVWIVGGQDKGNDYTELLPLVNEKVKAIICLGVDNAKIIKSFNNCVDTLVETRSVIEAVNMAYRVAEAGDTVLLSPACASFDLFENYEDRGRQFKNAVRNL